jgi:hypothetical protein
MFIKRKTSGKTKSINFNALTQCRLNVFQLILQRADILNHEDPGSFKKFNAINNEYGVKNVQGGCRFNILCKSSPITIDGAPNMERKDLSVFTGEQILRANSNISKSISIENHQKYRDQCNPYFISEEVWILAGKNNIAGRK